MYSFGHLGGIEFGVFRLRGVGLANCLFPWARCVVASKRFGLIRIASTWPQLCHRQWLRRDRDKRCYADLFDETGQAVSGARRLALLSAGRRINERDFLTQPSAYSSGIVVFSGIDGYFSDILRDYSLVREALIASTRKQHLAGLEAGPPAEICTHVRLGDFLSGDDGSRLHTRQPMSWYVRVISEIRRKLDFNIRVRVFSDGSDEELRPLLALPNVERVSFGSSVADLLALSSARVLLASGSTFSMWAAYLGRMPVIWPPGQRRQALHGESWEYEAEVGESAPPDRVIALIRAKLSE